MYKHFSAALPPKLGRNYISGTSWSDFPPPAVGDTVTFRASEEVDFYLLVEEVTPGRLCGELVYIEPGARKSHEEWSRGDKISVDEPMVTAIIYDD